MVDRIGHYRIVAELGRGGMGIVYKAHEESLNRFVAIKVLGEHLTEDPGHVERFLREARSAASLNHPNIVQIYAVSEEDGRHFFACNRSFVLRGPSNRSRSPKSLYKQHPVFVQPTNRASSTVTSNPPIF